MRSCEGNPSGWKERERLGAGGGAGACVVYEMGGGVFLNTVAPSLGLVLANGMFFSPLVAVLKARNAQDLGQLNPLPYPAITYNCGLWLAYSFHQDNLFIFFSNLPGFMLGFFFTLVGYGLTSRGRKLAIEVYSGILNCIVMVAGLLVTNYIDKREDQRILLGSLANFCLMCYYSFPLSTIMHVIRTKSAASLHLPLSLLSGLNGLLWFGYGMAIADYFIAVPNGLGALLAGLQLVLIFLFRKGSPCADPTIVQNQMSERSRTDSKEKLPIFPV